MDKEQILEKLTQYYEELLTENQDLSLKLMQTSALIAESFDYELPNGKNLKKKIINFIKKVIRKSTRFITKPYADKMRIYNESVCSLIGDILKRYTNKIKLLSKQNELLLQEINNCNQKIDEMQEILSQNKILMK